MEKKDIDAAFAPWTLEWAQYRAVLIRPELSASDEKKVRRLLNRGDVAGLRAIAEPSEQLVVLVPAADALAGSDWAVVDGIRADSGAYLLAVLGLGDADAVHNSLPARFDACRSAYWTAAITATDISKLLRRIEASPDVAGRDVDAAYREAVNHHRSVLAEISARIARLRVEEELGRSQSRLISTDSSSVLSNSADRTAAVRMANADLFGLDAPKEVVVPATKAATTATAKATTKPAAKATAKPPAKTATKRAVTAKSQQSPALAGIDLELRTLRNVIPATSVRTLTDKRQGAPVRKVLVPDGHVLFVQRGGEWHRLVGVAGDGFEGTAHMLVDLSYRKRHAWKHWTPVGDIRGTAHVSVADPGALVQAIASGAVVPDRMGQLVANTVAQVLDGSPGLITPDLTGSDSDLHSPISVDTTGLGERCTQALSALGLTIDDCKAYTPKPKPAPGRGPQKTSTAADGASPNGETSGRRNGVAAPTDEERQLLEQMTFDLSAIETLSGYAVPAVRSSFRGPILSATAAYIRMIRLQIQQMRGDESVRPAAERAAIRSGAMFSTSEFQAAVVRPEVGNVWAEFSRVDVAMLNSALTAPLVIDGVPSLGAAAPAQTPAQTPAPGPTDDDVVARMRRLNALKDAGLLEPGEYERTRSAILASL